MEKNQEQLLTEDWLKDVSRELETKSFKPEEMIACPRCERKSPPTRLKCFYCGADLPIAETHAEFLKPAARKIELWEKAFNLIFLPDGKNYDETTITQVARLTHLEADDWRKVFAAGAALPVLRVESENEAKILQTRLQSSGLEIRAVSDEILKIETAPRRLRRIEFDGDKIILILFNSNEVVEVARENLVLIVTGALFERRIAATERRKKGQNKQKESVETSADEMLIDLYTKDDSEGFRILPTGFDFSALGTEKEFFARENMLKIVEKLRLFAPEAKFADDYLKVRDLLGKIWEVEEHRDSRGLQRKSFGRFEMEKVTTISNLSQFTKYSRLQWQIL